MKVAVKHARMTYHSPLNVCDSNTSPKTFEKICLVFFEAPTETSTCRSKTANCEKMYDYDIANRFFWGEIRKIEVEEVFASMTHKAFFLYQKEIHEWGGTESSVIVEKRRRR